MRKAAGQETVVLAYGVPAVEAVILSALLATDGNAGTAEISSASGKAIIWAHRETIIW